MARIEAVLFDFDGTIADTNELISDSHFQVVEEYFPGRFQRDRMQAFNGPSLEQIYGHLDPEKKDEMIQKYRDYMMKMHDETITLFPGIKEMLIHIHQEGIKTGIVSAKRKDILARGVSVLGIESYIDTLIGIGDYQKPKPNPESVLLALKELQANQAAAMMVGDNYHDIEAGNLAGVSTVFVEWSEKTVASILPYKPDLIVANAKELELLILDRQS